MARNIDHVTGAPVVHDYWLLYQNIVLFFLSGHSWHELWFSHIRALWLAGENHFLSEELFTLGQRSNTIIVIFPIAHFSMSLFSPTNAGSSNAALNWIFLSQPSAEWNSLAFGGDASSIAIRCKVSSKHTCLSGERSPNYFFSFWWKLSRPWEISCYGDGVLSGRRYFVGDKVLTCLSESFNFKSVNHF